MGGLEKVYVSAGDAERVKEMLALDVDSLTFVEMLADGGPYTETVEGVEWTFSVEGGKVSVEMR